MAVEFWGQPTLLMSHIQCWY